jgi:hypothetical protein
VGEQWILQLGTSRDSKILTRHPHPIDDAQRPTSNPQLEIVQISGGEMPFEIENPPDALATIRRQDQQ